MVDVVVNCSLLSLCSTYPVNGFLRKNPLVAIFTLSSLIIIDVTVLFIGIVLFLIDLYQKRKKCKKRFHAPTCTVFRSHRAGRVTRFIKSA